MLSGDWSSDVCSSDLERGEEYWNKENQNVTLFFKH